MGRNSGLLYSQTQEKNNSNIPKRDVNAPQSGNGYNNQQPQSPTPISLTKLLHANNNRSYGTK